MPKDIRLYHKDSPFWNDVDELRNVVEGFISRAQGIENSNDPELKALYERLSLNHIRDLLVEMQRKKDKPDLDDDEIVTNVRILGNTLNRLSEQSQEIADWIERKGKEQNPQDEEKKWSLFQNENVQALYKLGLEVKSVGSRLVVWDAAKNLKVKCNDFEAASSRMDMVYEAMNKLAEKYPSVDFSKIDKLLEENVQEQERIKKQLNVYSSAYFEKLKQETEEAQDEFYQLLEQMEHLEKKWKDVGKRDSKLEQINGLIDDSLREEESLNKQAEELKEFVNQQAGRMSDLEKELEEKSIKRNQLAKVKQVWEKNTNDKALLTYCHELDKTVYFKKMTQLKTDLETYLDANKEFESVAKNPNDMKKLAKLPQEFQMVINQFERIKKENPLFDQYFHKKDTYFKPEQIIDALDRELRQREQLMENLYRNVADKEGIETYKRQLSGLSEAEYEVAALEQEKERRSREVLHSQKELNEIMTKLDSHFRIQQAKEAIAEIWGEQEALPDLMEGLDSVKNVGEMHGIVDAFTETNHMYGKEAAPDSEFVEDLKAKQKLANRKLKDAKKQLKEAYNLQDAAQKKLASLENRNISLNRLKTEVEYQFADYSDRYANYFKRGRRVQESSRDAFRKFIDNVKTGLGQIKSRKEDGKEPSHRDSDEYTRMIASLDSLDQIKDPAGLKTALADIKKSAQDYKTAKLNGIKAFFTWIPSDMRHARLAFADSVAAYCENMEAELHMLEQQVTDVLEQSGQSQKIRDMAAWPTDKEKTDKKAFYEKMAKIQKDFLKVKQPVNEEVQPKQPGMNP